MVFWIFRAGNAYCLKVKAIAVADAFDGIVDVLGDDSTFSGGCGGQVASAVLEGA